MPRLAIAGSRADTAGRSPYRGDSGAVRPPAARALLLLLSATVGQSSHDLAVLPGEWWTVQGTDASELEQELQREAPEGHVLHGLWVQAVGVRRHLRDVVFWSLVGAVGAGSSHQARRD
jgi:hypothetical protein